MEKNWKKQKIVKKLKNKKMKKKIFKYNNFFYF